MIEKILLRILIVLCSNQRERCLDLTFDYCRIENQPTQCEKAGRLVCDKQYQYCSNPKDDRPAEMTTLGELLEEK